MESRPFFRHLERSVESLGDLYPAAVAQGVLEPDDRAIIRLRMLKLDEMFDTYHHKTSTTRTMRTW